MTNNEQVVDTLGLEDEFNDHMKAAIAISDALFAVKEDHLTSDNTISALAIDINHHLLRANELHEEIRSRDSQKNTVSVLKT
jgi:hypothetical protein